MNQDFLDLLRALSGAEARVLVVGAYAVSYHAEPRTTGDLDIWVEASLDNASRVYEALRCFGAPLSDLLGDASFFITGSEHLLRNKKAAGRPMDLIDVQTLQRHRR